MAAAIGASPAAGAGLRSFVLFGSVARGQSRLDSDIDVVLEQSAENSAWLTEPLSAAREQARWERQLESVEWNLIVKSPDELAGAPVPYLDRERASSSAEAAFGRYSRPVRSSF